MRIAETTAQHLLDIKAVKLQPMQPFTWASGIQSPIYCDNRVALSHPKVRDFLKKALASKAEQFASFDAVAGVATAGIPHGTLLADVLGKPFIYVRGSAKAHGRKNLIEGDVQGLKKVLVVEDLISTGGSVLKAVGALQQANLEIVGVLAIFSYGFERAARAFAEADIEYTTLSDYDALIKAAATLGYVSEGDRATLERWRDNPEGWGALYA